MKRLSDDISSITLNNKFKWIEICGKRPKLAKFKENGMFEMIANIVKIALRFAVFSCQSEGNTAEMMVRAWFIDAIFYIHATSNPLHSPQKKW
ncbi:hypothetical protein DS893_02480 [Vibrionales bacterium C3R12]|nr:hypothetical protein DS893_02480 [Vibrionales bacterium C3R12]